MTPEERATADRSADPTPSMVVDADALVQLPDAELDAVFRQADVLPIEALMNAGGHSVDMAARTIVNDDHWKGWLPHDIAVRDIWDRLSQGYAKRFWKQRGKYLGETLYFQGRVLVKHELEEITIERQTNDLAPGRYVLLKYTDPVFEHVFYDTIRTLDDGTIVYRGYSGRFPEGKRGFTGVLRRRYGFAFVGVRDHGILAANGSAPTGEALEGTWRLDAIATSNLPLPIADVTFSRTSGGGLESRCVARGGTPIVVPPTVVEHFTSADATPLIGDLRQVDDRMILGSWSTALRGAYARLLLGGSLGLFHAERKKGLGNNTFRLYFVLAR